MTVRFVRRAKRALRIFWSVNFRISQRQLTILLGRYFRRASTETNDDRYDKGAALARFEVREGHGTRLPTCRRNIFALRVHILSMLCGVDVVVHLAYFNITLYADTRVAYYAATICRTRRPSFSQSAHFNWLVC